VVKSDKCMGDSQLLGHVPKLPPKSTPMIIPNGVAENKSKTVLSFSKFLKLS